MKLAVKDHWGRITGWEGWFTPALVFELCVMPDVLDEAGGEGSLGQDHRFYERGLSRKNYPLAGCDSIFLQPATFPMHRELPKAGSGLPHAAGYDLAHRFLVPD